jgi:hypothetical protein
MEAKSDTLLFVYHRCADTAYLLLYIDNIILTASSLELLQYTTTALQQQFVLKDLGPLHHFLDFSVEQQSDDLFLHQRQYARDILERASMSDCKPCSTPIDTQAKISSDMGALSATRLPITTWLGLSSTSPSLDPTLPMRSSRCASTCTTPVPHLMATKHILHYLQGTLDHGLLLHRASISDLIVYTNVDWAGCANTRWSTLGYAMFLGDNLISWSSKHQNVVSHSSAEAEYRVVTNSVAKACWLHQLLVELHSPLSWATLVYCDNVNTVYLSTNLIQH